MVPPSVAAAMASSQFKSLQASIAMSASVRPSYPVLDSSTTSVLDPALVRDLLDANLQIANLLKQTPFFLTPAGTNYSSADGIERYSDKYEKRLRKDKLTAVPSPHHLFPDELLLPSSTPQTSNRQQFSFHSAMAKLQQAERDGEQEKEEDEDKPDDDEGVPDEEVYEEEELEDETDYNLSYFDNGEDYNEDGGGDDGEPSY